MATYLDAGNAVNWDNSLNRNLVSWWLALPDQQRGVSFRDLCRRNHGVITSMDIGAAWNGSRGRRGGWASMLIEGNGLCTVTHNAAWKSNKMAVSCWVNVTALAGGYSSAWSMHTTDADAFELFANQEGGTPHFSVGSYPWQAHSVDMTFGRWTWLYAQTEVGATTDLYVDGRLVDSDTEGSFGGASNTANLHIGNRGGGFPINGYMDSIRLYADTKRDAWQVMELYNQERHGYPDLLNWQRRSQLSIIEGGAVTAYPWHYYAQMAG